MRNENRVAIMPVLGAIKELKEAYHAAPSNKDDCESLVRRIEGLLNRRGVRDALTLLLQDENLRNQALAVGQVKKSDLKDELELANDFGYTAKEVRRCIARVQQEEVPGANRKIASTDDLIRELKRIHASAFRDMEAGGSRFRRWRNIGHARAEVQCHLYFIATIIADGMTRDLFGTSYAVGTSGLAKAAVNGYS
jgi:hypothetical protein